MDPNQNPKLIPLSQVPSQSNTLLDDEKDWQDFLTIIETTEVPTCVVKLVRVYMRDGTNYVFPVKDWVDEGNDIDFIEETINDWLQMNRLKISGSDFIVDLTKLRETIQPITDLTLKDL